MTVVVAVNVEARYRGFLASVMLEIAPGVYTSPNMTTGIRERIWNVLAEWYYQLGRRPSAWAGLRERFPRPRGDRPVHKRNLQRVNEVPRTSGQ